MDSAKESGRANRVGTGAMVDPAFEVRRVEGIAGINRRGWAGGRMSFPADGCTPVDFGNEIS